MPAVYRRVNRQKGIDIAGREQRLNRALEIAGAGRRDKVHRIVERCGRWEHVESCGGAGIGGKNSWSAGVRPDRNPSTQRKGLRVQARRDIESCRC